MNITRFAYGTLAASLMAVGVAVFYQDSGGTVPLTAPTWIEISEAILERRCATSPSPISFSETNSAGWYIPRRVGAYVPAPARLDLMDYYEVSTWDEAWQALVADQGGDESYAWFLMWIWYGVTEPSNVMVNATVTNIGVVTNWSFNQFPALPFMGISPSLDFAVRCLYEIEDLCTNFVMEIDDGVPICYTVSNFWEAANLGDGVAGRWTIWATNSACGYGAASNLVEHSQTNVLWEAFRALALMTQTWRSVTWSNIVESEILSENPYVFGEEMYSGSMPYPDWFGGFPVGGGGLFDAAPSDIQERRAINCADIQLSNISSGLSTGCFIETADLQGAVSYMAEYGSENWFCDVISNRVYAFRRDSHPIIRVPGMPEGVSVRAQYVVAVTGEASLVYMTSKSWDTSDYNHWQFATSPVTLSESWSVSFALTNVISNAFTGLGPECTGLTNYHSLSLSNVFDGFATGAVYQGSDSSGVPWLRGAISASVDRAILDWSFTRCTNY